MRGWGRAGGNVYARGGRALSQGTRTRQHAGTSGGNEAWKLQGLSRWKEEDQSQGFITFKRQSSFWSDCVLGVLCDVLS